MKNNSKLIVFTQKIFIISLVFVANLNHRACAMDKMTISNVRPASANAIAIAQEAATDLEHRFLDAIDDNRLDIVKECVDQQVNLNIRGRHCQDALYLALYRGSIKVAQFLLNQKNINANAAGHHEDRRISESALHYVCNICASPEISLALAQSLITKGADINAHDSRGRTPLDIAIGRARVDITELLMSAGAQMKKENLEQAAVGLTLPLIIVLKSSHLELEHIKDALSQCHKFYDNPRSDPEYIFKKNYELDYEQKLKKSYQLNGRLLKQYYNVMRGLGHIHPKKEEWQASKLPIGTAKLIAYHAAKLENETLPK